MPRISELSSAIFSPGDDILIRRGNSNFKSDIGQIFHKEYASISSLGVPDFPTDATANLKIALESCAANNIGALIDKDIKISSECIIDLTNDLEVSAKANVQIYRDAPSSGYHTGITFRQVADTTTTLSARATKFSNQATLASVAQISVGSVLKFTSTEPYAIRRTDGITKTSTYFKQWVSRVTNISTNTVTLLDAFPFDFNISGYTVTVSVFSSAKKLKLNDLEFEWLSPVTTSETTSIACTDVVGGLSIRNYNSKGASFSGLRLNNCYDFDITSTYTSIPITTAIGLNYGIAIFGCYNGLISDISAFSRRHAITISGSPSYGIRINDSDLASIEAVSFDTHSVGEVVLNNCYLPNGVYVALGKHEFYNCTIGNIPATSVNVQVRGDARDFLENLHFENCKFILQNPSGGDRSALRIQTANTLGSLGDITFRNCEMDGLPSSNITNLILISGYANTGINYGITGTISSPGTQITVSNPSDLLVGQQILISGISGLRKITSVNASSNVVTFDASAGTVTAAPISRVLGEVGNLTIDGFKFNIPVSNIIGISPTGGSVVEPATPAKIRGNILVKNVLSNNTALWTNNNSYSYLYKNIEYRDNKPNNLHWSNDSEFNVNDLTLAATSIHPNRLNIILENNWFTKDVIIGPTSAPTSGAAVERVIFNRNHILRNTNVNRLFYANTVQAIDNITYARLSDQANAYSFTGSSFVDSVNNKYYPAGNGKAAVPPTDTTIFNNVGDIVINTNPASGNNIGWICVTAGAPGTWEEYGIIDAPPGESNPLII